MNNRLIRLSNTIFILLFFAFSNTYSQTPLEYNNKLADIITNLSDMGLVWSNKVKELDTTNKDYAELAPIRKKIQHYIDSEMIMVKGMKDVAGSEKYRQTVIIFLENESDMMKRAFAPFEKLNAASIDVEIKNVMNGYTAASKDEAEKLQAVTTAQKEYINKNGLNNTDSGNRIR